MNTVSDLSNNDSPARRRAPSVKDVARLAGVSIATVSRALSRPEMVRSDKLLAVKEAVQQLNYVAHGAGRALSSGRTQTIGAILPTLNHAIFANTAFALQKRLAQDGYLLLVSCNEYDGSAEREMVRRLIERGVEGVVLLGRVHEPDVLALLENLQIPYVLTWALDPATRAPCIGFDNRKAVALIVDHLVKLGHRRFGTIVGPNESEWQRERASFIRAEIKQRNAHIAASHIVSGPLDYDTGQRGMRKLMQDPNPPTAVICGHDIIAVGALTACHKLGISVPNEVSVTGFEDLEITQHLQPALTTVHFPADKLGGIAGDYVLQMVAGDHTASYFELPIELRVRETTAQPKQ
ncbi:LacI family DNA-binding transcriptional regulator [Afipia felis]